jgi:Tol biopolymer transport system component
LKKSKLLLLIIGFLCLIVLGVYYVFFGKPHICEAKFSPDNQFLVLSIKWGKKEAIYRVRKDGSEPTPLTSPKGYDFYPSYSPDGSKIVFCFTASDKPGTPASLCIINADGSGRRQLTSGVSNDTVPIFSKDGNRIYFVRAEVFKRYSVTVAPAWHDMDIYSIGVNGLDLKRLTNGKYYQMSSISFSPSGRQILVGIPSEEDSLWLIPLDKPEEKISIRPDLEKYQNIKNKPWATEPFRYDNLYEPYFMHSSNSLIFIWPGHYQGYFGQEIYLWNREKNITKKLTNLRSFITGASPSYDDSEIVFLKKAQNYFNNAEIWIVNSNGTNPRLVNIKPK